MNSEINVKFEIDKTTVRLLVVIAALIAIIVIGSHSVSAQEVAETISINTRVVFMDALVKDKRTGVPIAGAQTARFGFDSRPAGRGRRTFSQATGDSQSYE